MKSRIIGLLVFGVGAASEAQPAEFAGAARFRADFTYSVDAGHHGEGVDVEYSMSATGSGFLDPASPGDRYRASYPYGVAVKLSYVGRAVTVDGTQGECGMQETVVNEGLPGTSTGASCDPAELVLEEDGYEFSSNCRTVAVVHSYQWVGNCGQQFDYPDSPITTWWWEREEVFVQPFPHSGTYTAGATAIQLKGQSTGTFVLSPLFTSLAAPVIGTYSLSGTLTPVKDGLRLIIGDFDAYVDWRPSASPLGPGEPLPLTSRLTLADGITEPPVVRIQDIEWVLSGTSREPGSAMNFPVAPDDVSLDMTLEPGPVPAEVDPERQTLKRSGLRALEDSVLVVPFDWGGWTVLRVTATLTDGTRVTGEMTLSAFSDIRLPYSRPDSHIAQRWRELAAGSGGDTEDDEDALGDGLSLYEEYRGFYEGNDNVHVTGSATKRDLFVVDVDSLAAAGCKLYGEAAEVNAHCELRVPQLDAKVINANHHYAHIQTQHGLLIRARSDQPDLTANGWTRVGGLTYGGPAAPVDIDRIEIFPDVFSSRSQLAAAVAHELGHGTNLPHHGQGDRSIRLRWGANGTIEEVAANGVVTDVDDVIDQEGVVWLPSASDPQSVELLLGAWRGQSSGEEHCLMRYQANAYAEDANNRIVRRIFPPEVAKSGFCESNEGTSFNAGDVHPPSRFGPAAAGSDKSRVRIKDPH